MSKMVDVALDLFGSLVGKGVDEDEAASIVDRVMGSEEDLGDDGKAESKPEGAHVYNHSDTLQSSVEIGQTAKGEWYVKSLKLYFETGAAPSDVWSELEGYRIVAESSLPGGDRGGGC